MLETTPELPDSLQRIIKSCISCNRAAQVKRYHLFAAKMMDVCMLYPRSREEAEEVLQDGFMSAFT